MSTAYTLVIGNKNYSSWSLRAYLMLRHCEVPFQERMLALDTDAFDSAIADLSPTRRVPVLWVDHRVVWDTLGIAEWLAERYPQMWPRNEEARTFARCVSAEMHAGFADLRARMPMNCRARDRRVPMGAALERDIARIKEIWSEGRRRFASDGPWLAGTFSAADCMYAPVAFRFRTYGVALVDEIGRYADRLLNHPAVLEWEAAANREVEVIEREEVGQLGST